jgi:DNA-binding transcriptional LysR family regulator
MNTDMVRAFLVVLEEGSLNRAALRLHLAQSSLTRQMQSLEHELGGLLLERTAGGVAATAAGQDFARRMKPLLAGFDEAVEAVRQHARGQRSTLRVGYILSAGRTYLNPALAVLRRDHPEVQVKLFDMSPGEQLDALRKGEIDVALVGQEGAVAAKDFYTRRVATLSLVVVLPEQHALAGRERVRMEDLANELFIGVPDAHVPGRDRWITRLCRQAGFKPRFLMESDSLVHALSLVVSERAVVIAPSYVCDVPAAGVVTVPIDAPGVSWDFLVVWQRGKVAPAVKALVQAIPAGPDLQGAKAIMKSG